MDEIKLRAGLKRIATDADESAFAQVLVDSARESARGLAKIWIEGAKDTGDQAFLVLTDIEEHMVVPLIERLSDLEPRDASRALDAVVEAEIRLRQRIAATLKDLTEVRTELPPEPVVGPTEVPLPRLRVCDEAYLKVRRLLHFGEDDLQYTVDRDAFLRLPMPQRDAEIEAARESEVWNRLVGDFAD